MIEKLEMFLALTREQHFGKAAEALGITQPTLSAGIKQLEAQLGVRLVQRGSRYGGLTHEGERVLEWARRIVDDVRTMKQEMKATGTGLSGVIRLAVIPTALPVVADLTEAFTRQHPAVRFSVFSASSTAISDMLEGLQLDGGITYLDNEPLGRVTSVPLYREDYALICHQSSPHAAAKSLEWSDLQDVALCLLTPDMQNRRIIDSHLTAAGITRPPAVESNSTVVLASHVQTGRWATILPRRMAAFLTSGKDITAVPLNSQGKGYSVGLIAPDRDPQTPLMSALLSVAKRCAI